MTRAAEPEQITPEGLLEHWRANVDSRLRDVFGGEANQGRLIAAMDYALTGGGKRLRPLLVLSAASIVQAPMDRAEQVAVAVEMIHAYSLIHDDLPAMDDDDLRRGRPTCHLAFDEATAILAGDAMQTEAFHILSSLPHPDPKRPLAMIRLLSRAAGPFGMAGGQALDLALTGQDADEAQLSRLHALKTGELISASLQLGAMAGDEANDELWTELSKIGQQMGLAFQIQDDVLDATTETAVLGKPQGADAARSQPTFTSLLGVPKASERFKSLYSQAGEAATRLAGPNSPLRALIDQMENRKR